MSEDQSIQGLVRRAQAGDRCAFGELAARHRPDLDAFVSSRLGPRARSSLEPSDIVQETLLRAFQGLDRFQWRGPESLRRWLCAIAEHLIRNAARKRSAACEKLSLEPAASGPSPSRALRREERFERLERALRGLKPDHRKVLELSRIEGMKIQDIARQMHRSPGAVKQLLSRALEQLKDRFGDTESLSLPDRALDAGDKENG